MNNSWSRAIAGRICIHAKKISTLPHWIQTCYNLFIANYELLGYVEHRDDLFIRFG